jgi:RNA polymerase sigma-70 factor (ECF subfamily)
MGAGETGTGELLQRWHAGDQRALEALLERHLPWLEQNVRRRLGPFLHARMQTGDVLQDVALRVLQYRPRFVLSDEQEFRALLLRMVENELRDQRDRVRAQRREVLRERVVPSDTVLNLDPPIRPVTTPTQAAERRERHAWLQLSLELLDDDDRRVLQLREWQGMSFGEVGEMLGIPENTARMRFERALPKLVEKLKALRMGGLVSALSS